MMNYGYSTLFSHIAAGQDLSEFKLGNILSAVFRLKQSDVICVALRQRLRQGRSHN